MRAKAGLFRFGQRVIAFETFPPLVFLLASVGNHVIVAVRRIGIAGYVNYSPLKSFGF